MAAAEAALQVYGRGATPLDWARANALLGTAQAVAGEREGSPEWLEAAISSYAAAMTVYTREAAPFDWARMQRNTGAVLSLLGEQGKSQAPLLQAVNCYRAALEEYKDGPDHAMTQSNLGHSLRLLGERLNDRERMDYIFTVGCYTLLAMAFNTFGVQPEDTAEGADETNKER